MTSSTTERSRATSPATVRRSRVYSILIGIAALAVLLQGLWAGLFLEHDGERDAASNWIEVHARGGEVALVFAALATAHASWKRRSRRDLWVGGLVFTVLLAMEAYLGGLIVDESKDALTVVHVPVAMALMGLAVWLSLRASRGASGRRASGKVLIGHASLAEVLIYPVRLYRGGAGLGIEDPTVTRDTWRLARSWPLSQIQIGYGA